MEISYFSSILCTIQIQYIIFSSKVLTNEETNKES
jgi:hypothetical protein